MYNNGIYCAKPGNTIEGEAGLFQRTTYNFFEEVSALGAQVLPTASGFYDISPVINLPEHLSQIPRLSEAQMIKYNLSRVRELSKEKPFMANAVAPFSLLTMISSAKLMTWLVRSPDEILSALQFLADELAWYISELFAAGAKVVSLSDPHAQRELIGDSRFEKFCISSQSTLLNQVLKFKARGVLHLCPYCFMPLADCGFLDIEEQKTTDKDYEQALLTASNAASETVLIGRQCPHTRQTDFVYYLKKR